MLILGYLVPALVRRRQAAADSCVDDRFSRELRVVARSGSASRSDRDLRLPSTTALVAPPAIRPRAEELPVNRPPGMADRRTANEARRVAAVRSALAARRAEQAAAARRRLVLTVALAAVSAIAWAAVALAQFQLALAAFPTAMLAVVLWFGVRTARAERAERAQVPTSLTEPRAARTAGPTYSPSQLRSHLAAGAGPVAATAPAATAPAADTAAGRLSWQTDDVPVEIAPEERAPEQSDVEVVPEVRAAAEQPAAEGSWTPVPVPVPTYTLKPVAIRREAAPYTSEEAAPAVVADSSPVSLEVPVEEGIDLRAVLARRRAVGA